MRVFSYSRFSTDRQTEASITDQQRAQREYAERRGWTITQYFTDEGISGAAMGNRPGLLRLLEIIDVTDLLLVADLTRLSRSQELAPLLERLRFKGVRVIGVLDGFDISAPHARMQAGLSGLMSDELRANIRARVHLALESRAKTARPTGGRAFGYNNAGEPIEQEAAIVRDLFERYANGESMGEIVSDLNTRGVPSPGAAWARTTRRKDGRWLVSALHAILHNDRYIGRVVWNRSAWVKDPDSGKRIRRERPESEWIVNKGIALIERSMWDKAQSRLKQRQVTYGGARGGQPRYLLSGLLQCECCGAKLIVTGSKGSHYYCSSYRHGGAAACDVNIGVRRDLAESIILQPIRDELLSPQAITRATTLIRQWHRQERVAGVQEPTDEMRRLAAEIEQLEGLIASSPALAGRLRATLDEVQRELEAKRRQAWRKASHACADDEAPGERDYVEHVGRMAEVLKGRDLNAAREILRGALGDIGVRPDVTRSHLVATLQLNPVPLFKAAGIDAWNGSGGLLWTRAVALVR